MEFKNITNRNPEFYPLMGPHLANREVEKELGYPIYDDHDKTWFIATEDASLIGFCYLQPKSKGKFSVGSCYVKEQFRNKGVFRELLTLAFSHADGEIEVVTNKENMAKILLDTGFSVIGSRGSFSVYRKELQA